MLDLTKWQPTDFIRLTALIGAFFLAIVGAVMMGFGIAAEGAIDIKSTVISGSIKTASAGLFILFFAFAIIVYVLASLGASHLAQSRNLSSPLRNIGMAFWGALSTCFIAGTLGALDFGAGFGLLAGFLAILTILTGIAYIASADS